MAVGEEDSVVTHEVEAEVVVAVVPHSTHEEALAGAAEEEEEETTNPEEDSEGPAEDQGEEVVEAGMTLTTLMVAMTSMGAATIMAVVIHTIGHLLRGTAVAPLWGVAGIYHALEI